MNYHIADKNTLTHAVKLLKNEDVIIHSTDTLPGFACDATSDNAIEKIISMKNRKGPFSIIINSIHEIEKYAKLNVMQLKKIKKILPGPFTILLNNNNNNNLSKLVTPGSDLIGFRIPNHTFTMQLTKKFKNPIITTSINLTGQQPIINLQKVPKEFKSIHVYDDQNIKESKGSTILNFTNKKITILRDGDGIYKK